MFNTCNSKNDYNIYLKNSKCIEIDKTLKKFVIFFHNY